MALQTERSGPLAQNPVEHLRHALKRAPDIIFWNLLFVFLARRLMAVLQSGVLLFYGSAVQNNARRISTRARLTRWPYSIGASKSADVTFPFRQLIHKASKKAAWFFWLSSCNSGAAGGCAGHAKQHNKRDHPPELQAHGGCMTSAFKFHLIGHLESSIVCSALGYGGESQETREKTRAIDAEIGRSSLRLFSSDSPVAGIFDGNKNR